MSNSPSRHHVQCTVATQKHSKNPEIEYFWSIKKIAATSWTSAAEVVAPVKPTQRHRSNWWVSDEPTLEHRWNWTCYTEPSEKNSVAPVKPTRHEEASVQWPYYCPETMSSVQKPSLQHRLNRWSLEQSIGAMMSAKGDEVQWHCDWSSVISLTDGCRRQLQGC